MAQPNLAPFTNRGLIAKLEVSEGVDSVPTNLLNGIKLFDGTTGTEFDVVEMNEDRPFFGAQDFAVSNKRAFIEGRFHLFSPATPGQVLTGNSANEAILLPGGLTVVKDAIAKTTKYNPISSAIASLTAYFWHNDHKLEIVGARNAISALSMRIGERFGGQIRIQGDYTEYETNAIPAITKYTNIPPISTHANSTCTLLTVNGVVENLNLWSKELSVDFGSALSSKEYTSKKVNGITARDGRFTLRIARTDLADFNPTKVRDDGHVIELAYRLNETSALYSELGVRGKIENVTPTDIDGDHGWEITGRCIPSDAGGDEFYILHGDNT
jgi:hypothetical protein